MEPLKIVELGVNHPHGRMYRVTMGHHHGVELVGGYDPIPSHAQAILKRENVDVPVFDDLHTALSATEAEAALVTLPNNMMPAAIVAAAENGLHIFAEKPSAVSADTFEPAHDAVLKADVQFLSGYLRRFSPVATALRDLIAEGLLGEVLAAQVTYVTTSIAVRNATYLAGATGEDGTRNESINESDKVHWLFDRACGGGGIMHWLGVHWIDLLRFVTQQEFMHAEASLASRSPLRVDVEDVASVTLESNAGMLASISCAYMLPRGPDHLKISIQGSTGWAEWDGIGPDLQVQSTHSAWRSAPTRLLQFEADDVPGYSGAIGWEAFEQFRRAIRGESQLPMDVHDAMRTLQILDAIQLSGRAHQRVVV